MPPKDRQPLRLCVCGWQLEARETMIILDYSNLDAARADLGLESPAHLSVSQQAFGGVNLVSVLLPSDIHALSQLVMLVPRTHRPARPVS